MLADDRPTVGDVAGWVRFFPAIILVLILATTDYASVVDVDGSLLVWIVAASVLVGISEELMFRGNIVACLRAAALPEQRVWLLSSLLFGLIHLGNVGLGADIGAAIGNTAIAFFGGTMFYVVRRASGSILAAMALHALVGLHPVHRRAARVRAHGGVRGARRRGHPHASPPALRRHVP